MEISIGVQHVARELSLDVPESADEVAEKVADALSGAAKGAVLDLTSTKGRRVIIPGSALAFVEFGGEDPRRVGFGTL